MVDILIQSMLELAICLILAGAWAFIKELFGGGD